MNNVLIVYHVSSVMDWQGTTRMCITIAVLKDEKIP